MEGRRIDPLLIVRCVSCKDLYLGGMGGIDDPIMDVTYDDDQTFTCTSCYFKDSALMHDVNIYIPSKTKRVCNN